MRRREWKLVPQKEELKDHKILKHRSFHLRIRKDLVLIVTILTNLSPRVVPVIGESIPCIRRGKGRLLQAAERLSVCPLCKHVKL